MSLDSATYDELTRLNQDDEHVDEFDYLDEYPPARSGQTNWRLKEWTSQTITKPTLLFSAALVITWMVSILITFVASRGTAGRKEEVSMSAVARVANSEAWANNTALVDFEIDGAFNGTAIKEVCGKTEFVPGRWLACDNAAGGVGNVRNAVLACLRYSIESGSSWVLPTLAVRGEIVFGEEHLHTGGRTGLGFMWDVDYLKAKLAQLCPKMGVADNVAHVPRYTFATFPPPLNPLALHPTVTGEPDTKGHAGWPHQQNLGLGSFRQDFDVAYPPPESAEQPTIVRLSASMWQWIIQRDSFEFWSTFGRLLKFTEDTQVLASQVYHRLEQLNKGGRGYFGMHLRYALKPEPNLGLEPARRPD